jgi:hypothetical protein
MHCTPDLCRRGNAAARMVADRLRRCRRACRPAGSGNSPSRRSRCPEPRRRHVGHHRVDAVGLAPAPVPGIHAPAGSHRLVIRQSIRTARGGPRPAASTAGRRDLPSRMRARRTGRGIAATVSLLELPASPAGVPGVIIGTRSASAGTAQAGRRGRRSARRRRRRAPGTPRCSGTPRRSGTTTATSCPASSCMACPCRAPAAGAGLRGGPRPAGTGPALASAISSGQRVCRPGGWRGGVFHEVLSAEGQARAQLHPAMSCPVAGWHRPARRARVMNPSAGSGTFTTGMAAAGSTRKSHRPVSDEEPGCALYDEHAAVVNEPGGRYVVTGTWYFLVNGDAVCVTDGGRQRGWPPSH